MKCSCSLIRASPSFALCPDRLTVCVSLCSSVRLSFTVCFNWSKRISVWQIHFKVVTRIHWDQYNISNKKSDLVIVSIKFLCINFSLGVYETYALQMCVQRNITLASFRLSVICQRDSNINCGSLVFTELAILYLRVAARLFVNRLSFVIYFVYTRKASNFDK